MKKKLTLAAFLLLIILCGCSKNAGNKITGNNYSCYCAWTIYPGHDTTTTFYFSADSANNKCAYKNIWVKSLAGSDAGCSLR